MIGGHKQDAGVGTSNVSLDEQGVIVVAPRGQQSRQTVVEGGKQVAKLSQKMRNRGQKVLLLLDLTQQSLTSATGSGRAEIRRLVGSMDVDAYAVVGTSKLLTLVMYLARSARPGVRIAYFSNVSKAKVWLKTAKSPKRSKPPRRPYIGLIFGLAIAAVGILTLGGWQLSNTYLMGLLPDLRPMNPMAAVGLIVMSFGFTFYWLGAFKTMRFGSVFMLALGLAALLPLSIDTWLFTDKVKSYGDLATFADWAAFCFILMSIIGFIAGRSEKWVRPVELLIAGMIGAVALFNIFGLLYARDFMYGLSGSFVMALNLSLTFLIGSIGLALLVVYRQTGSVANKISRIAWLMVFAIIILQAATYTAWQQAVTRNEKESAQAFDITSQNINDEINSRLQTYIDALRGFSGFFSASGEVTQGDFEIYNDSLDLSNKYPGLRSVVFVAAVSEQDISAFVAERRSDTSLPTESTASFSIKSKTNQPLHYVLTYVADNPENPNIGLDLTSIAGRTQTYGNAIAAGDIYGSGTVIFPGLEGEESRGFFVTVPVKNVGSPDFIGLVNTNFSYSDFFNALFADSDLLNDVALSVTDNADGTVIYAKDSLGGQAALEDFTGVSAAGRGWTIQTKAPATYSHNETQLQIPLATLIVGQAFAILLLIIFISQIRARKQALDLVDLATKDLEHERNTVSTLHRKDEAILSSIGEGLIALDKNGNVELVNRAALQSFGLSEEELLGKELSKVVNASQENGQKLPTEKRPILQVLKNGKVATTVLLYQRKSGVSFPARITVAPILSEGKVTGAIEVFRDITQEYALDKAKGEFVSLASHQLRTPLSAINWYAEMLLSGDAGKTNKDQTTYLREIYEGNQRMIELVNALLDVSRLELGRMANQPEPTNFVETIESVAKELQTSVVTKKLDLKKQLVSQLPLINADPKQLRIVAQNLMSNAVKYTPDKGNVDVKLRRATNKEVAAAKLNSGDYIYFSVKDTGYGIPESQRPHIFEKLFRADNVRKMDVEGTGLGLYIVKQVVEGMGGKVWFESMESLGTTFHVVLPVKARGVKN